MYVKFHLGNLNPDPYPLHPISTYTCRVIIAPKMCGGICETFYGLFGWRGEGGGGRRNRVELAKDKLILY